MTKTPKTTESYGGQQTKSNLRTSLRVLLLRASLGSSWVEHRPQSNPKRRNWIFPSSQPISLRTIGEKRPRRIYGD